MYMHVGINIKVSWIACPAKNKLASCLLFLWQTLWPVAGGRVCSTDQPRQPVPGQVWRRTQWLHQGCWCRGVCKRHGGLRLEGLGTFRAGLQLLGSTLARHLHCACLGCLDTVEWLPTHIRSPQAHSLKVCGNRLKRSLVELAWNNLQRWARTALLDRILTEYAGCELRHTGCAGSRSIVLVGQETNQQVKNNGGG